MGARREGALRVYQSANSLMMNTNARWRLISTRSRKCFKKWTIRKRHSTHCSSRRARCPSEKWSRFKIKQPCWRWLTGQISRNLLFRKSTWSLFTRTRANSHVRRISNRKNLNMVIVLLIISSNRTVPKPATITTKTSKTIRVWGRVKLQ